MSPLAQVVQSVLITVHLLLDTGVSVCSRFSDKFGRKNVK